MASQPSLEVIAPTIEEALARGLAELGVTADAVTMEVLDPGSRGFLGFGARQVRIRLTLKPPEETVLGQVLTRKTEASQQAASSQPQPAEPAEPAAEAAPQPKGEPDSQADAAPENPLLAHTREVAETLLRYMDVPYEKMEIRLDEKSQDVVYVDIEGRDLNILIGRRAEVLNAFQYILSLIVGKRLERWVQVVVDVQQYRRRREAALQRLAQKMADQAVKTGRRQILEPMPANERRIIHLALRNRDDVETLSIGEEPHRKVTIAPRK